MGNKLIDDKLLKSRMALRGISGITLAEAQNWSLTTAYRKINGKVAFKAPEIQVCVEILDLDLDTANKIFFDNKMS